jgi:hypothetical protein
LEQLPLCGEADVGVDDKEADIVNRLPRFDFNDIPSLKHLFASLTRQEEEELDLNLARLFPEPMTVQELLNELPLCGNGCVSEEDRTDTSMLLDCCDFDSTPFLKHLFASLQDAQEDPSLDLDLLSLFPVVTEGVDDTSANGISSEASNFEVSELAYLEDIADLEVKHDPTIGARRRIRLTRSSPPTATRPPPACTPLPPSPLSHPRLTPQSLPPHLW